VVDWEQRPGARSTASGLSKKASIATVPRTRTGVGGKEQCTYVTLGHGAPGFATLGFSAGAAATDGICGRGTSGRAMYSVSEILASPGTGGEFWAVSAWVRSQDAFGSL
jgi:hypothetical protein